MTALLNRDIVINVSVHRNMIESSPSEFIMDENGNNVLFPIFVSSMKETQLQQYARRFYDENDIARSTILSGYMTEEQR